MYTFFIKTFGCKVNSCDSKEISFELVSSNFFMPSETPFSSDIIVINSCAVTSESVRKCSQIVRKFRKNFSNSIIVLTGCALDYLKSEILNEIDILIKKIDQETISEKILKVLNLKKINFIKDINFTNKNNNFKYDFYIFSENRTRAFIKIEDGCNNFCSYCVIPYIRGSIKSKSLNEIKKEIELLEAKNYKEIVLTGINLCAYGSDIDASINLLNVIEIVSYKFERIRMGSLDPYFFIKNIDIIDKILQIKNVCPSFHLSLQSGSDKILSKMNRKYKIKDYINLIQKIKNKSLNSTITTDLIVGFPDETQEDFESSIDVIKESKFIKVNVFPFSARKGTLAFNFQNQIDNQTKKLRTKMAIVLSDEIAKEEINKFKGSFFYVLFEKQINNVYSGYTENYIKIQKKYDKNLCGEIMKVKFV